MNVLLSFLLHVHPVVALWECLLLPGFTLQVELALALSAVATCRAMRSWLFPCHVLFLCLLPVQYISPCQHYVT
jgi:hypothetical protein